MNKHIKSGDFVAELFKKMVKKQAPKHKKKTSNNNNNKKNTFGDKNKHLTMNVCHNMPNRHMQ